MNCIDQPSDRKSFLTDKSSDSLRELKRSLDITDMWKCMNSDTIDYTYIDHSFRNWNSRIDILCACKNLLPHVESCIHMITPCPDHKAVVMSVQGKGRPRGPGY